MGFLSSKFGLKQEAPPDLPSECGSESGCGSEEVSVESGRAVAGETGLDTQVSYVSRTVDLCIENLCFTVETRGTEKRILQDINAQVRSGSVLAIIGGSGAGKTTLLDAIALMARRGRRTGSLRLNGQELNQKLFREHCSYVAQSDVCLPALTVRETLDFAAGLYQGGVKPDVRRVRVDSLLDQVGLDGCQHVRVGDGALLKGISGGQKRRLSVALELLKRPSLLVLDEPTSGLDSMAAEAIVGVLKRISVVSNLAMVCTIHQPSSYVFQQFDQLLVLARGQVCYFGEAAGVLEQFASIGYPSQVGVNPAEFLLRVTNADFCSEAQVASICDAWGARLHSRPPVETVARARTMPLSGSGATWPRQVRLLLCRMLLGNLRSPMAWGGRIVLSTLAVSFVSVVYLGARAKTQDEVLDRVWAVMWVQQLPAFLCIGAVPGFAREYACYRKEVKNGLYRPFCHFLADSIVSVPFWITVAFFAALPAFVILDFNWAHLPGTWLLMTCYIAFNDVAAQFCGTFCGNTSLATMAFILQTVLNMMFNGTLLARVSDVVWPVRWLFYVVPSKYTFRSGILLEFQGETFSGYEQCSTGARAAAGCCWGSSGTDVVAALSELFPVLSTRNTFAADVGIIILELIVLKAVHVALLIRLSR